MIESAFGFATWRSIDEHTAYLEDIYVAPNFRRGGAGTELLRMVEQAAKQSNKSILLGSTDISAANPEQSMLAILRTGFKVRSLDGNQIWFQKEI